MTARDADSQRLFELRAALRRIAAIALPGEAAPASARAGLDVHELLRESVELARLALLYADDA